jgi:hypothetical protein
LREVELHTQEISLLQSSLRQKVLIGKFRNRKLGVDFRRSQEGDNYEKIFKSPLHDLESHDSEKLPSADLGAFYKNYAYRDMIFKRTKHAKHQAVKQSSHISELIRKGKKFIVNIFNRVKFFIR